MDWDELKTKWLAIRLSDGGYDGNLYDSKLDAVRHQSDEFLCAYVAYSNLLGGCSPREMEIFLKFNRDAYDNGFRLPDPDDLRGGPDIIMTTPRYDQLRQQFPALSPVEEQAIAESLGLPVLDMKLMQRILNEQ